MRQDVSHGPRVWRDTWCDAPVEWLIATQTTSVTFGSLGRVSSLRENVHMMYGCTRGCPHSTVGYGVRQLPQPPCAEIIGPPREPQVTVCCARQGATAPGHHCVSHHRHTSHNQPTNTLIITIFSHTYIHTYSYTHKYPPSFSLTTYYTFVTDHQTQNRQ